MKLTSFSSSMVSVLKHTAGFANEAQLLLVNEASLQDLEIRLSKAEATAGQYNLAVERFRPNLVVGGSLSPYCEDEWSHLSVAQTHFQVAGGFKAICEFAKSIGLVKLQLLFLQVLAREMP